MSTELGDALSALDTKTGFYEIRVVSVENDDEFSRWTIQFLIFDSDGIRDIKEQEIGLPSPLVRDRDRVRAFAQGHSEALQQVFESKSDKLGGCMPHDLIWWGVLKPVRPQTPEEFTEALMTKKRLGQWL